ncbi:Vacuolar ER assembly isoform 1 [Chlorella sorokiniana]|uniref:Vacuolar ER assembly isoform 1 n=1 Tax=Chlorella sorokiniana TaxID=3076 RepID=A0A2P6TZP7_CHLSO|nr:Vacuolar ER assembly isoform 1 [Chlorella sorokiniana]|eukprot:PRW59541.1 Vacuolar ER assembly isoform 1 [Chlorella sorokiniana]
MLLRVTPQLRALLQQAAGDESLPQDLREAAAAGAASGATTVPWDTVKAVVRHTHERKGADAAPSLQQVCAGSGIAFAQPRKPAGKPPELAKRLEELKARLEQQQYDAMVADVTQEERRAAAVREGGLVTYKQQISFGVHVLAMMAAFYAFGHVAGMAVTGNRAVHPFIGLLFMVGALVLETVLFIIRTSVPPKLHLAAARRATAARVARQAERQKQETTAFQGPAGAAGAQGSAAGSAEAAAGSKAARGGGAGGAGKQPIKLAADKKED